MNILLEDQSDMIQLHTACTEQTPSEQQRLTFGENMSIYMD